ncbi:MAG: serine/threonine-protein kinase, partial [Casimicrobium sp.]
MTLQITANDWKELSPLVDQALELDSASRARWLRSDEAVRALSDSQRARLAQLLSQRDSPETDEILDTLPVLRKSSPHAADTVFSVGKRVGSYELIRCIGQGGMGEVWLAKRVDGAYERNVALKLPSFAETPARVRERMNRERDVLARLEHPNIARFYDAGVTDRDQPFIAMEYVEGDSLIAYVNAKALSVRDRCKLFLQVLDAVQFAHQRLVVHRDLKPSNILVRTEGRVALL